MNELRYGEMKAVFFARAELIFNIYQWSVVKIAVDYISRINCVFIEQEVTVVSTDIVSTCYMYLMYLYYDFIMISFSGQCIGKPLQS